jgi:uncharacterized protein
VKESPSSVVDTREHSEADATPSADAPRPGPLAWLLLLPIRLYRVAISPLLPPSCRFYPSCSEYAVGALTRHGAVRGLLMTLARLAKCAPWHPGGYDPVPDHFTLRAHRPDPSAEERP